MAHPLNLLSSRGSKFTSQPGVRGKEGMIIGKSKKLQKEHLTWTGTDRKQPLLWRSTRWGETSYMLPVRSRCIEEQREKKDTSNLLSGEGQGPVLHYPGLGSYFKVWTWKPNSRAVTTSQPNPHLEPNTPAWNRFYFYSYITFSFIKLP